MTDQKLLLSTMSIDSAIEFLERAKDLDTKQAEFELLMRMAKEGKFDNVVATSRTKEQVLKDLTEKHGFKVVEIKAKEENND